MDEINYKLRSNNSVLVVNAVEKLITTIKSKYKPADRQRFILENEELKFLREKCSSKDTVVSLTACQGLLALVECGVLEIGHTMSTVITLLPTAHNFSAIISTIAGLLILDLKCRLVPGQPYTCQFTLKSPQHPFITVLEKNSDATEDVVTQMQALCTHPDYIVSSNSAEMLLPVFLWMTCRPQRAGVRVWQLLLSVNSPRGDLLLDCLTWLQFGDQKQAQSAFAAISAVIETKLYQQQREYVTALLPVLANLSNEIVKHGGDPRPAYHLMDRCLLAVAGAGAGAGAGEGTLSLSLLADSVPSLCALHLHQMMHTCLNIITHYEYASISLSMFVAQSLQWLHLPSTLTNNALKVAAKILEIYSRNKPDSTPAMPNLYANNTFRTFMYTNKTISVKYSLFDTWERIRNDPTKLRCWFDNIEKVDDAVHLEMVTFLIGVVMEKRSVYEEFALRALRIVVKLIDVRKELAVQMLPILLYKIANDPSPKMKLECLKALPLMAKTKENVPTIVSVLNKLKTSNSVPLSTLITLHSALTEAQVRCFPYLQELLVDGATRPHDVKWEIEIAKAFAVKKVCETRPSLGLELVPAISSLLSRCAAAAVAALTALTALCRPGLVAAGSVWAALAPHIDREKRPAVLNSLFTLLSQLPLAATSPLWTQCAAAAWRRVGEVGGGGGGVGAAAALLARVCAAPVPLRLVPEIFRKTVKLPASYCKTPEDAARKPEDVLEYIPSEVWPEVFKYTSAEGLPDIRQLATRLIESELRGYRSGVYQPETRGEPHTMSYLPPHSVVRGLADYLRKQASSRTYDCPDHVLVEILRTLASEYPKPLPPMELWWVQPLLLEGVHWRRPGLELVARQATTSGSATRLYDNFLLSLCEDGCQEADIIIFFELLPVAAKNMPANSLRKPLEKCLADSFHQVVHMKTDDVPPEDVKDLLFIRQLDLIKECLLNEKINDDNRTLLSQTVEDYWMKVTEDNVSWRSYVSCCTALPTSQLERMTSPLSWWEHETRVYRASCTLRCELACHHPVWVNEIIDVAATQLAEQEYTLLRLFPVLQSASAGEETRGWLLQLMARTQVAFTETEDEHAKSFLWDVFVLSVVTLSGHWSFEPDPGQLTADSQLRLSLFPAALASLFERPAWREYAPRVVECVSQSGVTQSRRHARHAAATLRGLAGAALWPAALSALTTTE